MSIGGNENESEEGEIPSDEKPIDKAAHSKVSQPAKADDSFGLKRRMPGIGSAGVYIPPAKRRQLEMEAQKEDDNPGEDVNSEAAQRRAWEQQKRVVHGTINRLNSTTIKPLIHDMFSKVNLIRMRGVLAKSLLLAAVTSPKYSNVYAALIAVINSKLPEVGELVVHRGILAFRRHYRRREKQSCVATALFLAHLFHQQMVHELLILQILSVLLDGDPTDDSVEVAVQLLTMSGNALLEVSPAGVRAVLERLRALLHEGNLNKRVEYKMEKLLMLRKTGFRDYPPIPEELDLVESDDQITFEVSLDDEDIKKEDFLDIFRFDPEYEQNQTEWDNIKAEILGSGGDDDDSDDGDSETADSEGENDDKESDNENEQNTEQELVAQDTTKALAVRDLTEADLVHLRRTIYLTIMSSATFEECTHKLSKIEIPDGREEELINMLIECCSQERTFLRYYGLIASRFCFIHNRWKGAFMDAFSEQYTTIHRLETNKLRNVAKLFAHLLHTDAMAFSVLEIIHLNEDETTSSSRIFVKILIQEMAEAMGIARLKRRLETDDEVQSEWFKGMFPKDNLRNTRYAINFFTSIGLGPLTDGLREHLKNAPKLLLAQAKEAALAKEKEAEGDSDESSSLSSTDESRSSDRSSSLSRSRSSSYYSSDSVSTDSYSSRGRSRKRDRRRRSPSYSRRSVSSRSRSDESSVSRGDSRRGRSRRRKRSPSFSSVSTDRSRSQSTGSPPRRRSRSPVSRKDRRNSSTRSPSPDDKGRQNHRPSRSRSRSPPSIREKTRSKKRSRRSPSYSDESERDEASLSRSRSRSPRRPRSRSPVRRK